jgi:hypothetical protein
MSTRPGGEPAVCVHDPTVTVREGPHIGRQADPPPLKIGPAADAKIALRADDTKRAAAYGRDNTRPRNTMLNLSRSQLRLVAAAAAAVAVATLGLSACGGDDNGKFQEKTLKLTERDTDFFSFVDAPPKTKLTADGPEKVSNGDQLTFSSDLLDGSKKDVGDLDVTCAFTRATGRLDSSSAVCTGALTVPGGTLTAGVGGKAFAEGDQAGVSTRGSILGGTGNYAGATGDFISEGEPAVDTVHLFVPHK